MQLRLKLESAEATIEALDQLRLIMGSATKFRRRSTTRRRSTARPGSRS